MALSWFLSHPGVTSVIVGCSNAAHLADCLQAVKSKDFTAEELAEIDIISAKIKI